MDNVAKERTILENLYSQIKEKKISLNTEIVSPDNVFSIFEVIDKEVPYCRVLQYLIPEYWSSFEKNALNGCCNGEKLQHIEREHFCGAPCDKYNKEGRIDILLETSGHVVAIEVKVGAGEQDNQLVRYAKTLNETYSHKTKHIYFLTVDGHNSETCECDKDCEIKCKTDATTISFNKHICDWLRDIGHCEFPNPIAIQFLEVLELSQKNTAQMKQCIEILEESEKYLKTIQKLSNALPSLWEKIRTVFLKELTDELCNAHGFQRTASNLSFKSEVWAEKLRKENKELCLCYQTNFFIRTGEQNKRWTYISQAAFEGSREDLSSYCSQKEREAFNLKMFADSNDKLVEWFYNRERFPMAIQCIAESVDRFFCDNN
ncbi:MAG: PD-(D/E)XK nuclease family protein [Bacteroidaceae bacterium]|nr:PD-(D/E)XK nuclease family protein [Bacteroidaceae bacterium]